MSADAPLSYFYLQMLLGTNPLRRCAPAPTEGGAFQRLLVSSNKALPERVLYNSLLQIFFDLLPQMQETAALIRIISSRTMVFFTSFTNYFFST